MDKFITEINSSVAKNKELNTWEHYEQNIKSPVAKSLLFEMSETDPA